MNSRRQKVVPYDQCISLFPSSNKAPIHLISHTVNNSQSSTFPARMSSVNTTDAVYGSQSRRGASSPKPSPSSSGHHGASKSSGKNKHKSGKGKKSKKTEAEKKQQQEEDLLGSGQPVRLNPSWARSGVIKGANSEEKDGINTRPSILRTGYTALINLSVLTKTVSGEDRRWAPRFPVSGQSVTSLAGNHVNTPLAKDIPVARNRSTTTGLPIGAPTPIVFIGISTVIPATTSVANHPSQYHHLSYHFYHVLHVLHVLHVHDAHNHHQNHKQRDRVVEDASSICVYKSR
ncbi:hypothetical protein PG994_013505 [Apiospora phragmitis]|uniref:Uncharacterized protein n=1 Tax=Apiospora phragmitis TaxID=2905665 RepID=A0ABR1T8T4_9PEZI